MMELRDVKAREYHGEDKWENMQPESKACFDFLCGNHTRNLPIDWFNRLYSKWLQTEIGEEMKTAKTAAGGAVRLECSGEAFLRSLCKLTHRGHAQYCKVQMRHSLWSSLTLNLTLSLTLSHRVTVMRLRIFLGNDILA
jgi:hypothetical protein